MPLDQERNPRSENRKGGNPFVSTGGRTPGDVEP